MEANLESELLYHIFDPTGNITALVESDVEIGRQTEVAASIMECHPEVEQVGFVSLDLGRDSQENASLRMAGGEFCGNASMCAAVLYYLKAVSGAEGDQMVLLRVSGAQDPVEVRLHREGDLFRAGIRMPRALSIDQVELSFEGKTGIVGMVRMEGISHIVIEPASCFFSLIRQRDAAGRAVKAWCEELSADGLGLMFVDGRGDSLTVDPLVYVSCGETLFWENSCASGSSAVAMFLAQRTGQAVDLTMREPGGTLRVTSDPATDETWLYGSVIRAGEQRER